VRKATPVKKSTAPVPAKTSRAAAGKPTKGAARQTKAASGKSRVTTASKTKQSARPATAAAARQPKKGHQVPAAKARSAAKPAPKRAAATSRSAAKPAARPAPAPPRQPTRDEAAALKAFERAHKEFARGHFADARLLFRALIEQHGGVSEVTARARTYLAIAESRLRTESSLPRDAESLYDRGVIELNRGEYVAAQEMFERALKRDPEAGYIHYALAATRARLGSVEMALQSLERALNLAPNMRLRAQSDADLTLLRNEPDFERIVFSASRA
jgi:tetratricopeptide (TPR) repeat protein